MREIENINNIDNNIENSIDNSIDNNIDVGQYEYQNAAVNNYQHKKLVDMNTTVPFKLYENMSKSLFALDQVFPDSSDDIIMMGGEFNQNMTLTSRKRSTTVYQPNINQLNDIVYLFTDPEIVKTMKDYHKRYDEHLDKIAEKYPPETHPLEARILKVAKNNSEIMKDPDVYELTSGFSEYTITYKTSVMDMPSPAFVIMENDKKKTVIDIPRYKRFMENHVFLDQLEDKQNFFINEYIPYAKKMKAGTLTSEDAERYNVAYANHMVKQKRYFEEIISYNPKNDPDIAANKVCRDNGQFVQNWTGPRFGKMVLETVNQNIRLMDNGWPAADITFLNQLQGMKKKVDAIASEKGKAYTEAEKKAAKDLKKKMKSAYESIMNEKVTSPEDRMSKLENIGESVKDYSKLITGYRVRKNNKKNLITIGEESLNWLYDEAKGRKVFRAEVGKNKDFDNHIKNSTYEETNRFDMQVQGFLREADKEAYTNSQLHSDIIEYDREEDNHDLYDEAFKKPDESDRELNIPLGNAVQVQIVRDKKAYNKIKNKYIELADFTDNKTDKYVENDNIGMEMKEFVKARISSRLRRAAKGQSNLALVNKTPLGHGIRAVTDAILLKFEDDHLRNNMKKWQSKFPVYRLSIEGEKQLQTFADYYDEKEKAGGVLNPEREQFYRQKIYDQTVSMIPMMNKVFASVENKKIHDQLQQDEVIMDDQFCIHPAAQRGAKTLYSSLNAYKTGLENGWSMDDIPYIAVFNMLIEEKNVQTTVGYTTELEGYENREPLQYGSDAEKEFFERMRALSNEIKEKPIKSAKDRDKFIDKMNSLVEEGINNHYHSTGSIARYYQQLKLRQFDRSLNIGMGREVPFYENPVLVGDDRRLAPIMSDLTAARTDKWWSKESTVHENLRKAAEGLQKFMKENPAPGADADKKTLMEYSTQYLAKLDAVQHFSKLYQEAREGASTEGGKDRLRGARDIYSFAEREKVELLERMKTKTKEFETINDLRKAAITEKMTSAIQKLANMNAMPLTDGGKRKMADWAADIMTGRFALSKTSGSQAVNDMGTELMRSSIKNNSDFKKIIKSYLNDKTMTPAKLVEELTGDGILRHLKESASNFKKFEGKLKERQDKLKEFETKHLRNKAKLDEADNKKIAEKANKKAAGKHP